jgi:hypothetical protein
VCGVNVDGGVGVSVPYMCVVMSVASGVGVLVLVCVLSYPATLCGVGAVFAGIYDCWLRSD